MSENDKKYLIALSHFSKFGPAKLYKLKQFFKTWEQAFLAGPKSMQEAGIDAPTAQEFQVVKQQINPEQIIKKLVNEQISVLSLEDDTYPEQLTHIYRPPQILYYKGKMIKKERCLAVVGSRNASSYGRQVTQNISRRLAKQNLCIVSGLALGVDSLAHNSALEESARTIAVLGTGLDKQSIYPSQNRYLAEKIIDAGGAMISEFPPGTPPLRHHFPQRNRIISGLSLGVLVVEAKEKSGALITAKYALEQNREVFAVPGNIFSPLSTGTNKLIKAGAMPVSLVEDILESLDLEMINDYINKDIKPDNETEKILLEHLDFEPIHIDDLVRKSKLNTRVVNSALVIMEMKNMVKNLGNMQYALNK